MEHAASEKVPTIKSPTNFKSRIPQKIEIKIATSPTTGKFQSKIPRSTSLKYNKNEAEVLVQRQISEPTQEEKCGLIQDFSVKGNLVCVTNGNGDLYGNNECNLQCGGKLADSSDEEISNSNILTGEYSNGLATSTDFKTKFQFESFAKTENSQDVEDFLFNEAICDNKTVSENPPQKEELIDNEIHQQLSFDNALTSTPTTTFNTVDLETLEDYSIPIQLNENINIETMENTKTSQRNATSELPKNGFTKSEDFPDEDFERTEHDNDDYTTTTTTEYEKDGKMVRTTETINYQNDRNIKTRVTTSEKIVTIPYGQQLDLTNPEITSSTTVRSKYLQTMLQSREFEGDKEVNAETVETIETDIQTDKVDSNDNTNDPDLDTVLVIVETLDEVRTTEPKIRTFAGTNKDDPVYTEVVGVLNKSLSKFEEIEPRGKESVQQKRQNGIDYIQRLIQQLNTKLQENQAKNPDASRVAATVAKDNLQQPQAPEAQPILQKSNLANAEKPSATDPELDTKKGRKKSTLKKHFKFGNNKDAKDGDKQGKKKKKKLCVIS